MTKMKNLAILFTLLLLIVYLLAIVDCNRPNQEQESILNGREKPNVTSCDLCELLVKSFHKGMDRTAREHFGGGDTAWEEQRLGSYATSETRLVEIQEGLCEENKATRGVCQTLAEVWEHHLEHWWLRDRKTFPDLKQYLCETMVKVCKPSTASTQRCPPGFTRVVDKGCFDVDECLSHPCKRNEFCRNSEGSFSCTPCHSTCVGCHGSGPNQCKKLKRAREKRNIDEILESGKLLNFNSHNVLVVLITVVFVLVPCIFFILVPTVTF